MDEAARNADRIENSENDDEEIVQKKCEIESRSEEIGKQQWITLYRSLSSMVFF